MDRLLRLDLEPLGFYPPRFIEYLRGERRTAAFYPRPLFPFPDGGEPAPGPSREARRELFDEILETSRKAGASRRALEAGEALRDGRGTAVVTGQQPAILGGPLLTLYKIATAVSLAGEVTKKTGRPAAAIYWNGADDVDRAEIASSLFTDAHGALHRVTLPAGVPPPRTMVGTAPASSLSGAAEALMTASAGTPGEALVRTAVASALSKARDLGEFASALVLSLFADAPLLVLDARSRVLRRAGADLFRLYVSRREEIERAVNACGERLERQGMPRAVDAESTRLCLFATPRTEREHLEGDEAVARIEDLARREPESLSPNVVLRPILQEYVFPDDALVAGPGEAAYLAQIMPAFEILGVRAPRVYPRLLATIVPEEARILAERAGMTMEEVLADPDAARRAARPLRATDDFEAAYAHFAGDVARGFDDLDGAAAGIDRSFPQFIASARRKIESQIARLHEGARSRLAAHQESRLPGVKGLRNFLKPRGKPQERELTFLELPMKLGADWRARLEEAAARHNRDLEAGRAGHYALVAGFLAPPKRRPAGPREKEGGHGV